MTIQDGIKWELFMLSWREGARHGGLANMLAVAFVVRNRVKAGWHGGDWLAVIADHAIHRGEQATGNRQQATAEKTQKNYPDFHDEVIRDLLGWMDAVFDGAREDLWTEGALYYSQLELPQRKWFVDNIVRKPEEHPRVATVGPVSLFR